MDFVDKPYLSCYYIPPGGYMPRLLKRYWAFFSSREFFITAIAGVFILISFLLQVAGAAFWVHTSLALAAAAIGGVPILFSAARGLLKRQVNVDELVAIAIVASLIYREYL